MVKRLVLCLDGTWNAADSTDITNIVRLRDLIEVASGGAEEQRVYYHTGVGTGLSARDRWVGGSTGAGLEQNVRGVYKYLSQEYHDGLEIYILGFSRGAFTARSLAGYLGASGLLRPEHCSAENEARAWAFYRTPPDERYPQDFEALAKISFSDVRIRLLGVFDTVGALGIPLETFSTWNWRRHQFHNVSLGTNIDFALHALAIDEKRGPFQPSLWQYPNHKRFKQVEQVWFPGAHANIGGGYPDRRLSDRTLRWMIKRIERLGIGLKFISGWDETLDPSGLGSLYESRTGAYFWSRRHPMVRVINQQHPPADQQARYSSLPRHAIPLGEMLDLSALWRWKNSGGTSDVPDYRPANLEAALDWTFTDKDPYPIAIVGEDGEPLDWVKNETDRKALMSVLPEKYRGLCEQTAERLKDVPNTSDFSTSYQQPRIRYRERQDT